MKIQTALEVQCPSTEKKSRVEPNFMFILAEVERILLVDPWLILLIETSLLSAELSSPK
jgi:hypothetical protein